MGTSTLMKKLARNRGIPRSGRAACLDCVPPALLEELREAMRGMERLSRAVIGASDMMTPSV